MLFLSALLLLLPLALCGPGDLKSRRVSDVGAAVDSIRNSERQVTCPSAAHILACSGHGGLPHAYGLLETTVDDFLAAIPGSDNYSLPYPKKDPDRAAGVAAGAQMLTKYIARYTVQCPDTPIILLGYSEGGIVIMNTLCGRSHIGAPYGPPLNRKYAKNILATITYGEETRVPNQSYNEGTCLKGQGVNPRGNPYGCEAFADNIQSYCDAPDPQCCGGNRQATHFQYPAKYDTIATQYVSDKYFGTGT